MLGLSPTAWLLIHAALAAATVGLWLVKVTPNLPAMKQRRLVIEVWAPFALVAPLLCGAAFIGDDVSAGTGWMPIAGPILCAMIAGGIAVCRSERAAPPERGMVSIGYAGALWVIAGVMLLMLCAADTLTVLVGQCTFAIGAVVLWINTPATRELDDAQAIETGRAAERAAGTAVALIVLLAAAQCVAIIGAGAEHALLSGAIAGAALLVMLGSVALSGPAANGERLAGWCAALGALFGLGVLSMLHVIPHAMKVIRPEQITAGGNLAPPPIEVAYGFAVLAPEASGLILLGLLALAGDRLPKAVRSSGGAILALGSACLILWRLLSTARWPVA